MRLSSLAILLGALVLAGCGEDKSPPVDASKVGPRGALKSQAMQDQMQSHSANSAPAPGTNK